MYGVQGSACLSVADARQRQELEEQRKLRIKYYYVYSDSLGTEKLYRGFDKKLNIDYMMIRCLQLYFLCTMNTVNDIANIWTPKIKCIKELSPVTFVHSYTSILLTLTEGCNLTLPKK